MADATAAEWYPSNEKDADKAPEAAKRLADIFATDQGRGMLFVGDKYGPTSEDRLFGLAFLRNHPDITGKTLSQSEHGWTSPAVVTPYAQLAANQYLALRSDIPVAMKGFDLENTIGFALNLKLDVSEKDNIKDLKTKLANGEINCYANSARPRTSRTLPTRSGPSPEMAPSRLRFCLSRSPATMHSRTRSLYSRPRRT